MNRKTLKMLGFIAGGALASVISAQAQDKATLDLLVSKKVITQSEADDAMKNAAVITSPRSADTKKLQIEGMLQVQYDWVNTMDKASGANNPPSVSQFEIRRAYLGAIADLGNGWGGEILMDFAAGPNTSAAPQGVNTQNNFEKAVITKVVEGYGLGAVGYQKVNFTIEENTSSAQIKEVERSMATRYFTETYGGPYGGNLGFANRHVGLFWNGDVKDVAGLYYGASIANGIQSSTAFGNGATGGTGSYNQFSIWGNVGYVNKVQDWGLSYRVGLNMGVSGDGNSISNSGILPPGAPNQGNQIWGYNPYVTVGYQGFELTVEFIQAQIENGRVSGAATPALGGASSDAQPYGFNVTPSYKINDQWEIVGRLSILSTNGRGMTINTVQPNAPNVDPAGVPGATTPAFNNAYALYIGFNYYIIGNSLKLSAGYEFSQYTDRQTVGGGSFNGSKADVNAFRTRLQVLF